MEKQMITMYTDGACSGNPGPGGYAAIVVYNESEKVIVGAEKNTTNNKMELMAAIKGLEVLTKPCEVTIYSDSAYLVNAYNNKWINSWKNKGWKTASREPVKNIELWQELERLGEIHNIKYVKVKGHSDNKYNNRCDELAVQAIKDFEAGKLIESVNTNDEELSEIKEVFGSLPVLETPRLILRLFDDKDIQDLYEYASDEEVTKYITFKTYNSISDALKRIESVKKNYAELNSPITWAIQDKETAKMIGSIDFVKWDIKNEVGVIGYVLNKKYWKRGLASEALKEVIKFGFEKMKLNRIEIVCDERNIASSRVMEKNGLKYEGTKREAMLLKNEYVSLKIYSILKNEFVG